MVLFPCLIAIASVAGLVQCQSTYSIDAQDIAEGTRDQWCTSQTSACPLICLQLPGASETPTSNDCDPESLSYRCVCDNGQSPNASEYSQTIPYYLCTEQNNRCVDACPQTDASCQDQCRTANPCGAQNPKLANTTSTGGTTATNTAASTTSSLPPFTGLPDDDDAAVRPLTDLTLVYGLFVVLGGFFAGFATLL
ncbi:uncharacterized protein BJX67DRAFT_303116 [Aspergillus lucknowensis]|uniref:DUF7707 domain-containing protein n=1 Tax=Aspergillus lucknowensis TaxID=176173 RepID=A0ABR4LZU2_9EURO